MLVAGGLGGIEPPTRSALAYPVDFLEKLVRRKRGGVPVLCTC
jgi:hypothetical protein